VSDEEALWFDLERWWINEQWDELQLWIELLTTKAPE